MAWAGAGPGSFNHRYAMPGGAGTSVLSDLRPVDLFPFADRAEADSIEGRRGGLLETAPRQHAVPKIFYTYTSTEYWARLGSLAYTSVDGAKELRLAPGSRLYFFAGTPHDPGPFPPKTVFEGNTFVNAVNFARPGWILRALLLDLDAWVSYGKQPPVSVT